MPDRALIDELYEALDRRADAKTKAWWESYMKGVIPFRGVGIPGIREEVIAWRESRALDRTTPDDQLRLVLALFHGEHTEDKLAGILYLELFLRHELPWRDLVVALEGVLSSRLIHDWNTCDWLCVRVLGPMIAEHGLDCARAIAAWRDAEHLWQARAALVPFVKVVADPELRPLLVETAAVLLARDERFAKTAVGWVLRDLSKHDVVAVREFLDHHLGSFSIESLRNATKYLDRAERDGYVARFKRGAG